MSPKKPKSPTPLDELGNALYSIYYHCEWRGLAGPGPYTDDRNRSLDLGKLPPRYGIKPMSDAVALLHANPGTSPELRKFVIALLVRSSGVVVGGRYDGRALENDVTRLLGGLAAPERPAGARRPGPDGLEVRPLVEQILALLRLTGAPGGTPVERFQKAYHLLTGQDISSYSLTTVYEKIV
jgi:hypothetical protein